MWRIISTIAKRLFWSQRNRVIRVSDNDLRAIARAVIGDGKRPFAWLISEARDRVERIGAKLDDELDARLVHAIDIELARIRLPEQLEKLHETLKGARDEFDKLDDEPKK